MRLYISGGMTGWPDNNLAAFEEAAVALRAEGHEVTSPVELDPEEVLEGDGWAADDEEYEGFLERDLALINADNLDGVVFIQGWKTSGGAGREGRQAILERLALFTWVPEYGLRQLTVARFLARSRTERLRREEVQDGVH